MKIIFVFILQLIFYKKWVTIIPFAPSHISFAPSARTKQVNTCYTKNITNSLHQYRMEEQTSFDLMFG